MAYEFCLSETDAKTKTCPMTMDLKPTPLLCVGSQCMAWRWVEQYITVDGQSVLSGDTHGYCGMAGPPWNKPAGL